MSIYRDVRALTLRVNEMGTDAGDETPGFTETFAPVVKPLPPSAANQIRNGDIGHSVRTWNAGAVGNQDYETAHFFTHDAPVAAQQLDESTSFADLNVDADATPATNKTLKSSAHANYSAQMCDWDRADGTVRMQGTKTLDAPLPGNTATPNAGLLAVAFRAALRNSRIVVPAGFRLFAGVWDNTAGQRDWLKASVAFSINASVRGTPGATVERRYKVFLYTDRGYTFISNECIVPAAPTDASYSTSDVYLTWALIPGVLAAHVYMYVPSSGVYKLLSKDAINTALDNGTSVNVSPAVTAYPAATDDRAKAYVATADGALSSLAVNGVDAAWDTIYLNIAIPRDYSMTVTLDKQWLRIGQSAALDRRMSDAVVNNGSTNVDSATGEFTALDTGRAATLTDALGNTHTTTLTYVDADSVTLGSAWPHASATGVTLYIVGGGDKGLLLDLIHASYTPGSVFAPHPEDLNRTLPPAAAPDGSSQGGVGSGGGGGAGGGGIHCVAEYAPVLVFEGSRVVGVPFRDVTHEAAIFGGGVAASFVQKKIWGACDSLLLVRFENGCEIPCSPAHRIITHRLDSAGRRADSLCRGDTGVTYLDGRIEVSRVREVVDTGLSCRVGTFSLEPGHLYFAGCWRPRTLGGKLWAALRRLLGVEPPAAGVLSHNRKTLEEELS